MLRRRVSNELFAKLYINLFKNGPFVVTNKWSLSTSRTKSTGPGPVKKLFTPGPLGCSQTVKEAMLYDLGSRDDEFINTVRFIRTKLLEVAGVTSEKFTTVPLQGSGTYAIEAVLQTTTPRTGGKLLILSNGAYGQRMKKICDIVGITSYLMNFPETDLVDVQQVEEHLKSASSEYTLIAVVHCETTSGVINPVEEIGRLVKQHSPGACYFVDAMSSFGAVPLDVKKANINYIVSSANKCLQGVPGFSFVIADIEKLKSCKGNCRSLSLDLVEQWEGLESNGQFRFTPPTHSMLAFRQALLEYEAEGCIKGRAKRYDDNRRILQNGMKKLGFEELLGKHHKGYIITSFLYPNDSRFIFSEFYRRLNDLGQVIYPGKVTQTDCFRIGNIGELYPEDMKQLLLCVEKVCKDMGLNVPVA